MTDVSRESKLRAGDIVPPPVLFNVNSKFDSSWSARILACARCGRILTHRCVTLCFNATAFAYSMPVVLAEVLTSNGNETWDERPKCVVGASRSAAYRCIHKLPPILLEERRLQDSSLHGVHGSTLKPYFSNATEILEVPKCAGQYGNVERY